jgi:hypothetical protein
LEKGVGCAAVLPAALIGWAGLADGIGPTGWLGVSEFVGWAAACLAASLTTAAAVAQVRWTVARSYIPAVLAMLLLTAMTLLINWLGADAPMAAKIAFTSSLHLIGTTASVGLVVWIGLLTFKAKKSH